ncbi:unnamed protein product [Parnassius apollo]|uniref:(apollo) hypothetical protein n=1 Tax=Parnassius apollo TaxID=110799 RepID=A0A8S3Y4B5_PARAO|nr:unnamed protein product [Parnassius apollo]
MRCLEEDLIIVPEVTDKTDDPLVTSQSQTIRSELLQTEASSYVDLLPSSSSVVSFPLPQHIKAYRGSSAPLSPSSDVSKISKPCTRSSVRVIEKEFPPTPKANKKLNTKVIIRRLKYRMNKIYQLQKEKIDQLKTVNERQRKQIYRLKYQSAKLREYEHISKNNTEDIKQSESDTIKTIKNNVEEDIKTFLEEDENSREQADRLLTDRTNRNKSDKINLIKKSSQAKKGSRVSATESNKPQILSNILIQPGCSYSVDLADEFYETKQRLSHTLPSDIGLHESDSFWTRVSTDCENIAPTLMNEVVSKIANYLVLVPPVILALTKTPLNYDVSSVQIVLSAAAVLRKGIINAAKEKFKNLIGVYQGYGMTEATAFVTMDSFIGGKKCTVGSVGKVKSDTVVKIVDVETREPLGPNQNGEICVKGTMIMKGYIGKERSEDFDEEGFFKTGDIGYYDEDKYLYIVDRLKELIKYKGYQVPPAELEAVLLQHKGVRDVGVVGLPYELATSRIRSASNWRHAHGKRASTIRS